MADEISLYERVGGSAFFEHLVDAFYEGVATDAVLSPLYPEYPDFSGARHRLTLFLVQYWGGPTTYSDERGHPRLRMRHMPFTIAEAERDRWLVHMLHAVDVATSALDVDGADRDEIAGKLRGYFVPGAEQMRNNTGLPITSTTFRPS
jgi:hemoglobin